MIWRQLVQQSKQYLRAVRDPLAPPAAAEQLLFSFGNPADLARWRPFSDSQFGGQSTAELAASESEPGTAELRGHFSTVIPAAEAGAPAAGLLRSGFAGVSSLPTEELPAAARAAPPFTEGRYIDLEPYTSLVFRVRGDGRQYIASLRTDNWIVEQSADRWQAFLHARPGEWQDVAIPLSAFLLTWKGRLVEQRIDMNPGRVVALGVSLAGGSELQPEGAYRLGLHSIRARRD